MSNILEEYLVRIGAEVDRNAFNGANRAITQLANALKNLGSALKIGGIIGALAKLAESIVSNIKAVADLDMEYQKLANSMWVTKETAKNLKIAMSTMGASEQDIAWIPELREQFFRLREEMNALATPTDADGQLRWIRDIGYDIQSLQVKFKMLREWIVYYLIKYLKPYIEQFRQFIQWINKQLGDNMPKIAQKIAKFLSGIVSVAMSVFRLCKNIFSGIYEFVERIPSSVKKLALVFAAVGASIMMSPFGLLLTAIGGAMLLLEDFFYFLDGKKSSRSLAPMWRAIMGFANGTGGNFLKTIKRTIGECIEMIGSFAETTGREVVDMFVDGAKSVYKYLKLVIEELDFGSIISGWADSIKSVVKGVTDLFSAVVRLFKKVDVDGNGIFTKFFKGIGRAIGFAIRQFQRMVGFVGKLMSAIAAALDGNFKQAASILGSSIKGLVSGTIQDVTRSIMGGGSGIAGGNSGGADRAAQLVAEQPQNLLGNPNGCTFFVQTALGSDNEFMKEMGGNLWVPDWVKQAQKSGRYNEGTEGMKKGDIIVVDYGSGEGDHVIMYDGEGGYYGNSTSKRKPVHGSLSDFEGNIAGYIRTGAGGYGGGGGGYSVNPNSYAAAGGSGYVPAPAQGGGFSIGNIIVNVAGTNASAEEIGTAVQQKIINVRGIMAARSGSRGCLT